MPNYYHNLTKEQKKDIKKLYKKEYQNTNIYNRLIKLNIYSLIGIICGITILILSFEYEKEHTSSIIIAIILFLFSIIFFIGKTFIKRNILNKIVLENKSKTNK